MIVSFLRALVIGIVWVQAGAVIAQPYVYESGPALLPLAGLELELPFENGVQYRVESRWSYQRAGSKAEGIDEIATYRGDERVATTQVWVIQRPRPVDCAPVLQRMPFIDAAERSAMLWGTRFALREGSMVGSGLKAIPAVAGCVRLGDSPVLMLFLHAAAIQVGGIESAPVPRALWAAVESGKDARIPPLSRFEVVNVGTESATYRQRFDHLGIELEIPDDGSLWSALASPADQPVALARRFPALPERYVEFIIVANTSCAAWRAKQRPSTAGAAVGLPEGWKAGPSYDYRDGLNLSACRDVPRGALVVTILPSRGTDIRPYAPLIRAIETAARS